MDCDSVEIRFVRSWPIDEIIDLYRAGGWWKERYDSSLIPQLIAGSFVFAVVVEKATDKAVGMGRVLSDGVSDAYIQDVVVLPSFRGFGCGKCLVESLVKYCISRGVTWVGVIAEPGSEAFYMKNGFSLMKSYSPLLYDLEE